MSESYRISHWKPKRSVKPVVNENGGVDLFAIQIEFKYQFINELDQVVHEYLLPNNHDIVSAGGYIGKVFAYREAKLFEYLSKRGISPASFVTDEFPLLASRSPQLDLILFQLAEHLRTQKDISKVKIFDHGCTVAEHYDLLDAMFRAASNERESAQTRLCYTGLDNSAYLLNVAKSLHPNLTREQFDLLRQEGSEMKFSPNAFDFSLSVGVLNHVASPLAALEHMIHTSKFGVVLALWTTTQETGFWTTNHAGWPFYFFSQSDLLKFQKNGKRWYSIKYVPESEASQPDSYIGLDDATFETLGEHHLVMSDIADLENIFGWGAVA